MYTYFIYVYFIYVYLYIYEIKNVYIFLYMYDCNIVIFFMMFPVKASPFRAYFSLFGNSSIYFLMKLDK